MLCILTQDGSVYLIDDEMNIEPKHIKALSKIKLIAIDITDSFCVMLDYRHHCYIWKNYEEIISIKNHSDFSYIEKIGAANDYYVCYDFSGLLGFEIRYMALCCYRHLLRYALRGETLYP